MRRTILLYGISLAILVILLKWLEYRFFVRDLSIEFYVGIIAILFTAVGVWAGRRLTQPKAVQPQIIHTPIPGKFELNNEAFTQTGLSPREFEVLQNMAEGLSNQEIADKLFVSLSTVKTHSANIFLKLDVKRRTQAIQRAKELGLIP